MSEVQDNEIVTLHLHGGTKIVALITPEDLADESARVEDLSSQARYASEKWDSEINCAEELIESALTVPPKPGWRWVGDAFVFTQAVAGVEYGSNP